MNKNAAIAAAEQETVPVFVIEENGEFICWKPAWGKRSADQKVVYVNTAYPFDPHHRFTEAQRTAMRAAAVA